MESQSLASLPPGPAYAFHPKAQESIPRVRRARAALASSLLGALATAALLDAAPLWAQPAPTLLWSAPGIENVVCLMGVPDIDGDGGADVVFESYDAGAPATDNLYAIRGASSGTGEVIWSARPLGGPSNSGGYGDNCLRLGSDVNGDGYPDPLLGMAWGNRSAFAIDGRSGETEWSFDTYTDSPPVPPVSGWVYAMADLGQDLNGDGVSEVLFGVGSENDGAYCASGRDGAILWRYQAPDVIYDVLSTSDLNGDGVRDAVVGSGDNGNRVIALSGAGGGGGGASVLWFHDVGSVQSLTLVPDINGDDLPEVVAGTWGATKQLYCLSGSNGAELWSAVVGDNVMRVVTLDDVSGDGFPDIAVGSWQNAARVHDGMTGQLFWFRTVGTLNGGDVWAIDRVDDITGDGVNDVVAGSFDCKVYLMDGVTGVIQWAYNTGNRIFTVRGVPDLSFNGVPDVVAGTQKLTTGGICYAFEGGGDPAVVPAASMPVVSLAAPNPFRDRMQWTVQLGEPGSYSARVIDAGGRRRATLFGATSFPAGPQSMLWNGKDDDGRALPSGVYLLQLVRRGVLVAEQRVVKVQ